MIEKEVKMPTAKAWTMNCVLAGVKAARLIDAGDEAEAQRWLTNLSSELDPVTDVPYLLMRIKDRS